MRVHIFLCQNYQTHAVPEDTPVYTIATQIYMYTQQQISLYLDSTALNRIPMCLTPLQFLNRVYCLSYKPLSKSPNFPHNQSFDDSCLNPPKLQRPIGCHLAAQQPPQYWWANFYPYPRQQYFTLKMTQPAPPSFAPVLPLLTTEGVVS